LISRARLALFASLVELVVGKTLLQTLQCKALSGEIITSYRTMCGALAFDKNQRISSTHCPNHS
jgi:hypothetical protein